jgi:type II secretory pathway pseudopilin PulG
MRQLRPTRRDERGSLIVVMGVIMILFMLSGIVMARTLASMASVRQDQDFSAALSQADAALSDAMFRIDQFATNDITSFCVGDAAKCFPTTVPGAPVAKYRAIKVNSDTMAVMALGTVNRRLHAIQATVSRSPRYPFAVFGTGDVTFNGNGSGTIQATLPDGSLDPNRFADSGSNSTVTCHSGGQEGDQQVSYKNSWNGCPTPTPGVGTYLPKDPVVASVCPFPNTNAPPVPCLPATGVSACPVGGVFAAAITGIYYCTGDVTFSSAAPITVIGSVQVFVIPTSGTANVGFASTTINDGGDPRNFVVHIAGAGTIDMGNGAHNATITGVIDAPSAQITTNGCKMDLTGALVIGTFTCNGGPNLIVHYDSRLQSLTSQDWTVRNYSEIPSGQFSLPGF